MNTLTTIHHPIALTAVNGKPTASSLDVARHFGKRHDHVIRDIRNLIAQLPEGYKPNFGETVETRANPSGGAPIKSPAYHITRDGFTLLAMGFTGKEALAFKLAYIDAFNRLEATMHQHTPQRIRPTYMREAWFYLLENQAHTMLYSALARALNISKTTLTQVLNGSGNYGTGQCSTDNIACRVLDVFYPLRRRPRIALSTCSNSEYQVLIALRKNRG